MERESQRIDKWLWCVRVFKTRSMATDACRKGKIELNGQAAKASAVVKPEDRVIVFRDQLRLELLVAGIPRSRLGAKLVPEYMEDLTDPLVVEAHRKRRSRGFESRDRGEGRPTKKDRRSLDRLKKGDNWQ